mmetsp:Transcript_24287/g.46245  ORF Transcript_24287/g.46245 Transcript_24287/m.46245 type:complete len:262 (-) Transcript_24287:543-1328(-)
MKGIPQFARYKQILACTETISQRALNSLAYLDFVAIITRRIQPAISCLDGLVTDFSTRLAFYFPKSKNKRITLVLQPVAGCRWCCRRQGFGRPPYGRQDSARPGKRIAAVHDQLVVQSQDVTLLPWHHDTMFLHKGRDAFQHVRRHFVSLAKGQGLHSIIAYVLPSQIGSHNGIGKDVLVYIIIVRVMTGSDQSNSRYSFGGNPDGSIVQPGPFHTGFGRQFGIQFLPALDLPCILIRPSNGRRWIVGNGQGSGIPGTLGH